MCSLKAVYFQKSIFWKTEEILLNIDFLFKCQMLWTFHLLITFQTDAWNKILGFPTSKIFPLHLCSYSLSSHSLHQYLNFCPPTCIQKYIYLVSTTFTILLEVLHFIYHYLLWFNILAVLLWFLNCRRSAANQMLAQYWRQLFRNANSLRDITVWIFISMLFAALGVDMSQRVKAQGFSLIWLETEREALGSEKRTVLWSAKSLQGWHGVRHFQTSFILSFVHLVYQPLL